MSEEYIDIQVYDGYDKTRYIKYEDMINLIEKIIEKIKIKQDEKDKEIERLNNIIDKAIEYIDWQRRNPQYDNVWRNAECEDLIEILKGSDKE